MTIAAPNVTTAKAPSIFKRIIRIPGWAIILAVSGVIYASLTHLILSGHPDVDLRFRIDFTPFLEAGTTVQIHVASALTAFFVGLVLLLSPKGTGLHKPLGWTWIIAMGVTASSSFFLRSIGDGDFSPIHGLSVLTVLGLPMGVAAVRRRNIKRHAKSMTQMYLGGMVIAGLFTFLPGRLMWSLFFSA